MKVNLFMQRSLHLFHLLLPFICHQVAANTEIINFSPSQERSVGLPWHHLGNGSKLHPSDNERQWTIEPAALPTPLHLVCERDDDENTVARPSSDSPPFSCPHELWVFLDLDDDKWVSYSTFTLRLSWPASTPVDFAIALYSPQDLFAWLARSRTTRVSFDPDLDAHASSSPSSPTLRTTTRSRYARIRAVNAGLAIPGSRSHSPPRFHSHPPLPPRPRVPVSDPILPPGSDDVPARQSHLTPTPPVVASASASVAVIEGERGGEGTAMVSFVVILEPLYLGVLPASLFPTVCFLVPLVLAAALSVGRVIAYLEPFVLEARADARAGLVPTRKER